ncbi:major facilitator superfamily transporter [Coniochaeta sp. 2T2.1]|nr:major facilitator superfamily transporter [Coniochaeta sp. 2T2.1]
MTASQAAGPSSAGPNRHNHNHNHQDERSQWQHTPNSSTATSDQLTPDSDSDSDSDLAVGAGAGLLGSGHDDTAEAYELQDRRQQNISSDDDDEEKDGTTAQDSQRRRRRRRAGSTSTAASFTLYTPDEERAVVRKFDRRLVLFVALLYMLSFLDRSNIGNAYIAGLDTDLQPTPPNPNLYPYSLTAFYISYILFEPLSLLWKIVPAHVYVTCIVLSWGVVASLQSLAVNYPMLITLRFLLGIGEAAFTGVPYYLSFFFKREELAFRTAVFVSAAPLATSFASALGWGIMKLGEGGPIASWRLLFLVEGFPSVVVAVVAWRVVPDGPGTAGWLNGRERRVAVLRLRGACDAGDKKAGGKEEGKGKERGRGKLDWRKTLSVLGDASAWLTGLIFLLSNMAYSSLPVFLPTILTRMGHSPLSSQLLAAPPYLSAFFIVLAASHLSDKLGSRSPLLIAFALLSALGYGVLALSSTMGLRPESTLRYLAVYPAAAGFFTVVVLTISWSINNQADESRRGGGFALLQVMGQCGPLVGARLYPDSDGPFYTRGMGVCCLGMVGVAVLAGGLRVLLKRRNRRLDQEEGVEVEDTGEAEGFVGGKRRGRRFRYML